ncbi:hypothetical protein HDU81_011086 [Chytriomyces hyalinus]|nr:hypothetical protein HDU81_011086 [Chytriomyces hyalinus]
MSGLHPGQLEIYSGSSSQSYLRANHLDLVPDPFFKIRSILFDIYKVPRTVHEISFVGIKKSVLEIFVKDSDLEEAITTLSNPGSGFPTLFITTNLLDTPQHRRLEHANPARAEQLVILHHSIMLACAMRQGVTVMQEIAQSNVDWLVLTTFISKII